MLVAEGWEGGTRGRKTSEGPDLGWRGWWELRDRGGWEGSQMVVVLTGMGPRGRRRSRWATVSSREERRTKALPPALRSAAPSPLPGTVLLEPATETPSQTQVPEFIHVTLNVSSTFLSYRHSVSVPVSSSLEDVLKKAQEHSRFR